MSTEWKTQLPAAIDAELASDKTAKDAEISRRETWWATTWILAGVPKAEWSEAKAEYATRTGHTTRHADKRRFIGGRFSESLLGKTLPQARFAQSAADWVGAKGDDTKIAEAIKLLAKAERDEMSLREFSELLTGKPWTKSPEDLTAADEEAIVEKVAKERPAVIAKQASKPKVAREIAEDKDASKAVVDANMDVLRDMTADERKAWRATTDDALDSLKEKSMTGSPHWTHEAEDLWTSALRSARLAVASREKFRPNKAQLARMGKQADEMEVLTAAFRGESLLSEDDLEKLLSGS